AGDARELRERTEEPRLRLVVQQRRLEGTPVDARGDGIAQHRAGARVRVLHRVDGVVVRPAGEETEVDVDVRVRGAAGERVASRVDADRLDEVLERDDRAGTLRHPDRFTVADEVDQLPDEDLEVDTRHITEGRAH